MKAKTIKAVLKKKFNYFLESIDDEETRKLVSAGTIITGGSIASMLLGEDVNDYDLYFKDRKTTLAVAKYYAKKMAEWPPATFKRLGDRVQMRVDESKDDRIQLIVKSAGIASENGAADYQYFETINPTSDAASEYVVDVTKALQAAKEDDKEAPKYRPIFVTTNAITLSDKIQIVLRFYGEPDEIHENYDFVHCTNYWTSWEGKLVLRQDALEALLAKELRYVGSKYPLCSIIRTRKFIARGWSINAGQYLKMAMQLNELDLGDVNVLQEQLIGVDTAYFIEIISLLKEKNHERVDHAYLMEIIDRIF